MTAPIPSQSTPESSNTPNALVMTDILIDRPCRSVAASLRTAPGEEGKPELPLACERSLACEGFQTGFDRRWKPRASACFFLESLPAAKSGRSRGHAPASERAAARIIAAGTNRRPPRGKARAKRPVLPRRVRIVCPRSDRSEAQQTRRHRDRHKMSHFVLPFVGGAIRAHAAPTGPESSHERYRARNAPFGIERAAFFELVAGQGRPLGIKQGRSREALCGSAGNRRIGVNTTDDICRHGAGARFRKHNQVNILRGVPMFRRAVPCPKHQRILDHVAKAW
jgi:hypothetical protein